ncbi:RTA1 like protein [Pochonia chlamydosporia 170]|uniref:RTA1 like protein n=1 Tax=Pochonia chlamydosporia 170 TaxID=1380566 RepID=A0A179FIE8_METCM|nr:RTA1 like protein [Pochonia chlamydosporia 170]OAQ65060.1 RTA1 like protein [Pochonia chlamydosporia 170]
MSSQGNHHTPHNYTTSNITESKPNGYIDPNFPNPHGPHDVPIIIYGFTPSFALALFAAIWFTAFFLIHTIQLTIHRTWYFSSFTIGLLFEITGYIARSLSAKLDPYHLIYFVLNYFFIVTAPVFLAAGIYTILSVLISRLGTKYTPLSSKFILWFFITSDAVATITQVAGASLIGSKTSKHEDPTTANNILVGGLAYQVFSMSVFVLVGGSFLWRARRVLRRKKLVGFAVVFCTATLLVYLRTVFRLAETAEGLFGSLQTHEVYFAVLEFAPVAAAVGLFAGWHPGRCLGGKKIDLQEDGKRYRRVARV